MVDFDAERVRINVRNATTEDLLDRVSAYRAGMEPEAVDIIEAELRSRGITVAEIEGHAQLRELHAYLLPDGTAAPCSYCRRPAVGHRWDWYRLWGLVPVLPRYVFLCEEHQSDGA